MAADGRAWAGRRALHTARGDIEVGESGPADGLPLLLVHGSGGGFDQGLSPRQALAPPGVRVTAPSRFGYLRSPMRGTV
jgi:2-hydroxy-6-oxonona-2,4-dienedioate hydrolase